MTLPEPLVPAEADMRGLQFMPLDVVRLMDSDLYALSTGEEFKAAVSAWCKSWLQVPAGSLPDDDRILAHLTGAGKRWLKVKDMALRGFIRCSDGRLYHPVVCEKVVEAWAMRIRQRNRSAKGNAKRWGSRGEITDNPICDPHGDARSDPHGDATWDRKGQGQGQGQEGSGSSLRSEPAQSPPDPIKGLWDRGSLILGSGARSLIGKARKDHGDVAVMAAIKACEEEKPSDPAGFFAKCLITRAASKRNGGVVAMHPGAGG